MSLLFDEDEKLRRRVIEDFNDKKLKKIILKKLFCTLNEREKNHQA